MISHCRTYIVETLAEIAPAFREWPEGFNFDNIPRTIFDKAFHVEYGDVASTPLNDLHVEDFVGVTLRLFYKGYRQNQAKLEEGLDSASCIRQALVDPRRAMGGPTSIIKNVICDSIIPSPVVTNDNNFFININLRFRNLINVTEEIQ